MRGCEECEGGNLIQDDGSGNDCQFSLSVVEKSLLNLHTDIYQDQTNLCLPFVGTEIATPQYEYCDDGKLHNKLRVLIRSEYTRC